MKGGSRELDGNRKNWKKTEQEQTAGDLLKTTKQMNGDQLPVRESTGIRRNIVEKNKG